MTIIELKIGILIVLQLFSCNTTNSESNQAAADATKHQMTAVVNEKDTSIDTVELIENTNVQVTPNLENERVEEVEGNEEIKKETLAVQPTTIAKEEENTGEEINDKSSSADNTPITVSANPALIKQELHATWDSLMKKYVSSTGDVDYTGLKQEMNKVDTYLGLLKKNSPGADWKKNERLAYWINVYNAATVKLILKNYPVKSIISLHNGKPWDHAFIKIGDKTYTLNDIEHKIIRPKFKEPRIHFAVNCAAVSCPKLLNEAYLPSKLEDQLEKQTKLFVNNKSKNQVSTKSLKLSKIFDWYKEDFGNVITFLKPYTQASIENNAAVNYLEYDWALNKK